MTMILVNLEEEEEKEKEEFRNNRNDQDYRLKDDIPFSMGTWAWKSSLIGK